MVQRLQPHPYLALFNGPDTSLRRAMRDSSTVPLQALFLLNNPFVHEQAGRFAGRLLAAEPDPSARLRLAYLRAFAPAADRTTERGAGPRRSSSDTSRASPTKGVPADRRERRGLVRPGPDSAGVERVPLRGLIDDDDSDGGSPHDMARRHR